MKTLLTDLTYFLAVLLITVLLTSLDSLIDLTFKFFGL